MRKLGIVVHWVYVAYNLMPWEAYDPIRQRWTRLPRIPCDECFSYVDNASLAVGTQLLVFGRELTWFATWKYNLVTHDWSRCLLMNLPRCLFGSGSLGKIAILAGVVTEMEMYKCAEMYNSETGTWVVLPDEYAT